MLCQYTIQDTWAEMSQIVHYEFENLLGLPLRQLTENIVASFYTVRQQKLFNLPKFKENFFNTRNFNKFNSHLLVGVAADISWNTLECVWVNAWEEQR